MVQLYAGLFEYLQGKKKETKGLRVTTYEYSAHTREKTQGTGIGGPALVSGGTTGFVKPKSVAPITVGIVVWSPGIVGLIVGPGTRQVDVARLQINLHPELAAATATNGFLFFVLPLVVFCNHEKRSSS